MQFLAKKFTTPVRGAMSVFALVLSLSTTPAYALDDNASKLTVGFINIDWYPFNFKQDDQTKGFAIDVVEAVLAQMRRDVNFQRGPFSDGIANLNNGTLDAYFGLAKNLKRIDEYHYSQDPLYVDETVLISRTDDTFNFDGDVSSLIGSRVGMIKGAIHGPAFDNMNGIIRVPYDSGKLRTAEFFHDLQNGEPRFIVANSRAGSMHFLRNLGLQEQLKIYDKPVAIKNYYLVFSKTVPDLEKTVRRFDRLHKLFRSTKEYEALIKKYNLNRKLFPK